MNAPIPPHTSASPGRVLYKIYAHTIALLLFVVVTIITALVTIIASFFGDKRYVSYYGPVWWSRITLWLFLLPVHVEGRDRLDPRQSYVFLANHQGYFDIFLIYAWLGHNFKWMMKEYLRKIPFVGLACARSGQIYVGDSLASIGRAVRGAQSTLRGGMSMVIFPEGTRTHDGRLGTFRKGAFTLAGEIGLPIVPLTINGSFHVFNRHARSVSRSPLSLTIHQPITAEERQGVPTRQLMKQVFNTIDASLEPRFRTTVPAQ